MADQDTLYPLEFFIRATPSSQQAGSASIQRWKSLINQAALDRIRDTDEVGFVDDRPVSVTLFYFPSEPMIGDIDNIVKPILDALIGRAYRDDHQIERIVVQKFEGPALQRPAEPSRMLAAALDAARPIVYIRVDDDLSWRTLR